MTLDLMKLWNPALQGFMGYFRKTQKDKKSLEVVSFSFLERALKVRALKIT